MFRNECGKVFVEDARDQQLKKWNQFVRRRAGCKAAQKAMEARILAMGCITFYHV
jgi:hypothetical protein